MMQQLQQSISVICSEAAKAYIRSDENTNNTNNITEELTESELRQRNSKIYHFLASHFEQLAETKQREQKIAVSRQSVAEVFSWYGNQISNNNNNSTLPKVFENSSSAEEEDFTKSTKSLLGKIYQEGILSKNIPRANQRDITSFLETKKINTSALPEVFELCRALQQVMQKRLTKLNLVNNTNSSSSFGTTNAILFVAVFSSLATVKSLFDLLCLIMENCDKISPASSSATIQMICATFSTIDKENSKTWNAVSLIFSRYPGLNLNLLLELFPSIETMGQHGGKASSFVDDVEEKFFGNGKKNAKDENSSPERNQGPTIVSYNPEDEEGDGGRKETSSSNDQDDEENDDEEEVDVEARNDFWAGLTAAPSAK